MANLRILIATSPFGKCGRGPLDLLEDTGWQLVYNSFGRRLRDGEVDELIRDVDGVIAGTEPYTARALAGAQRFKVIARVGIGLDSVDLTACRENGVLVTYTPDAPSQAVAELTAANILNLCRHVLPSDRSVREGAWNRFVGVLLRELTVGVVGVGRIGKLVCQLLLPFGPALLGCDLEPDSEFGREVGLTWVDKETLFGESDLVTLHIPGNPSNHHYVDRGTLALMKTGSYLVNTSRGSVVDEESLADALLQWHLAGAALDVYEHEPYEGPLARFDNVVLTAHMGASARASRYLMELGAAEDLIRALEGQPVANPAPGFEGSQQG